MTTDPECLFCKIVAGEAPSDKVRESDRIYAFRDINPQAPTHVLVIPKEHHADVGSVAAADPDLLAELIRECTGVAEEENLQESGHRLVFNTGSGAGQLVFHAHAHVLGGRPMEWPPG